MADSVYKVMIAENTYYLWLSDNSGTRMDLEDTHTIYTITGNM
jgi:hypothetical protein